MTAPERIWVFKYSDQYENPVSDKPSEDHTDKEDEYVRADIAKAERDAALATGLEAAAAVVREITADSLNVPISHDELVDTLTANILSLAPMTPLTAALALPEVRELVGAGRLAEQQLIALGSDGFGSGLTAALAKLEAAK